MKKKELVKQFEPYYHQFSKISMRFYDDINEVEECMKRELGDEYEFAWVDGWVVGIGKVTSKEQKIILHDTDFTSS